MYKRHACVELFVVAADDDEHAVLRQHLRQAAGQALDGAAAHASAHEKGHPLVRRDAEGGPAFRTAAGCEEDLTHGDAGGDELLFGNAAPGEFVYQLLDVYKRQAWQRPVLPAPIPTP